MVMVPSWCFADTTIKEEDGILWGREPLNSTPATSSGFINILDFNSLFRLNSHFSQRAYMNILNLGSTFNILIRLTFAVWWACAVAATHYLLWYIIMLVPALRLQLDFYIYISIMLWFWFALDTRIMHSRHFKRNTIGWFTTTSQCIFEIWESFIGLVETTDLDLDFKVVVDTKTAFGYLLRLYLALGNNSCLHLQEPCLHASGRSSCSKDTDCFHQQDWVNKTGS